ncbi:uncharacterized protein LOC126159797 [Schistocerca cancellata]|uniref:uncharacterized protein LOC126159797 n=1 Tax=Schistocerca cancellata TaxID=274614 RepID=UPI00211758B7|nr:uncharacterized protein LOC126159797 [Schistocerca cancellata]
MYFVTNDKRRTVKFKHWLYCRTEAMDQEPTMWIKKEGTDEVQTELCFMAQVYPCSMNVKEELEEGANKESVEDPLGIFWSTDFIKEDPELNLEMNITENTVIPDLLRCFSWSSS